MQVTVGDRIIAYLTLLSGLSISAVAVYYSVAGLVSIFAASVVPIIVMGVCLEVSKLIATVWLKINWKRAPVLIRGYLLAAITVLMIITSLGIFGFLSRAHSEQAVPTGDVVAKLEIVDSKIQIHKDNIDAARRTLAQMDAAVDETMSRTTSAQGASRAAQIRKSQARERSELQREIQQEQEQVSLLNLERAPLAAQLRKVEAEVGPIKYIAGLIYDGTPDKHLLESAVTWVIIVIVAVFDPLAVILLLASQYSFQWFRQVKIHERAQAEQAKKLEEQYQHQAELEKLTAELELARSQLAVKNIQSELDNQGVEVETVVADGIAAVAASAVVTVKDPAADDIEEVLKPQITKISDAISSLQHAELEIEEAEDRSLQSEEGIADTKEDTLVELQATHVKLNDDDDVGLDLDQPIDQLEDYITEEEIQEEAKSSNAVDEIDFTELERPGDYTLTSEIDLDNKEHPNEQTVLKIAKTLWKKNHPDGSLKHQRELLNKGLIEELPWATEEYLELASKNS